MGTVSIDRETETDAGWCFSCRGELPDGSERSIELGLSWADYDHWAPDGSVPPQRVAAAVVGLLLNQDEPPARDRIDAALLRRLVPGADAMIQDRVRKSIPPSGGYHG